MSLVAHKYTPAEMSPQELEATFTARGHTVDYLLDSLRRQTHSGTLSSFLITGPRGAGKSTIIQMVALRISQDPQLKAAWLPVIFPEEQFNIVSLRDLLAATLQMLAKQGIDSAKDWLEKVEADANEEQSLQLGMTGLRQITKRQNKRLILFIENLNLTLEERFDEQMQATFRRLLMSDPFMMVVGSAVHDLNSLKSYDEAFFNYFGQVPLGRLKPDDVFELLRLRAVFDGNQEFLKELPNHKAKIQAIALLSGGNPRLTLMLYELLSQRQVTSIVQYLRRLVDELTPLLKHEIENLPPQQSQIIHALMEKGGAAKPTDLVSRTRLPLNAITAQLGRLKEAQFVEVLGGGKGRAATYIVPDKLFAVWYQMRYLSQNRRRIEMFVEVLRVWFEEEERFTALRTLVSREQSVEAHVLRDSATRAEYFADSLKGTQYQDPARELCIGLWAQVDSREAASVYADLFNEAKDRENSDETWAFSGVVDLLFRQADYKSAIKALDEIIAKHPNDAESLYNRGLAKGQAGNNEGAISDFTRVIDQKDAGQHLRARALVDRGVAKGRLGNEVEAISDFDIVVGMKGAAGDQYALALFNRGYAKDKLGHIPEAISDYTSAIESKFYSSGVISRSLFNRAVAKKQLGDNPGAIDDYTTLLEIKDLSNQETANALFNRGNAKIRLRDPQGAIADFTALIEMKSAPSNNVARAFVNRGVLKNVLSDTQGAISDWSAVIDGADSPIDQVARALLCRWLLKQRQDSTYTAVEDLVKVIDLAVMADDAAVHAAKLAYGILWSDKNYSKAKAVLSQLACVLQSATNELASASALRFLNGIAAPGMEQAWQVAWHILAESKHPEVVEALGFLKPVCDVLEGKNRMVLDRLPPEQREFAENVLKRFEAK